LAQEQPERRMQRTGLEKAIEASPHRLEQRKQRLRTPARGVADGEVARTGGEVSTEDARGHDPAIEQGRETSPRPPITKLCEHERNMLVLSRDAPADAQRAVERLVDESRHFGLVGHLEARIQIRLERELTKQRQAERVDRADGHVCRPVAQLPPAGSGELAARSGEAKRCDDPLAHLSGGLARERERKNLGWIDALTQQVHVAIDEDARLARPCRRLARPSRSRASMRDSAVTGSSSNGSRPSIMHVVLPAYRGIRTEVTQDLVGRLRRELTVRDAIDDAEQPRARGLERFV